MRMRHGAPHERKRLRRPVARLLAVTVFVAAILPAAGATAQAQPQSRLGAPGAVVYQDLGGPPGVGGPGDLGGPPVLDVPSLSVADVTVGEGNDGEYVDPNTGDIRPHPPAVASLTVSLSSASTAQVTVDYETSNDTATAGSDYTAVSGTLTFSPGETSKTVAVTITKDTLDEWDETFKFTLSDADTDSDVITVNIGDAEATVTITDNDDLPSLSVAADVSVAETVGDATVTVTLSEVSGRTVTAHLTTTDGTGSTGAMSPDDYLGGRYNVSIPAGQRSVGILIPIVIDNVAEAAETFTVTLSNPTNATVSVATGTVTINDLPSLSVAGATVNEGDGSVTFTVSMRPASSEEVTVAATTSDGTAIAGSDYTATTGSVSFAPGDTSMPVTVSITDDSLDEDIETFTLTLSNPTNATISDNEATAAIIDDDDPPSLSVADTTVNEGDGSATLTVRLSAVSGKDVTVDYATSDGSAKDGDPTTEPRDYAATSGTLTITAGQRTGTVSVPIDDDRTDEDAETFTFTLSDPQNATGTPSATVTITDNDDPPTLSVEDVTVNEGEGNVPVKVQLSVASTKDVMVNYATSDGTATAGSDYTAVSSGSLSIPAGQTTGMATVSITDDSADEDAETFTVTLSNPQNATGTPSATVTIADNDDPPTLSVADVTVNEGDGTITLTVTLSATSFRDVTVKYATSDGTATAGSDYTAVSSGSLSIPAGQTTGTATVSITDDPTDEDAETFTVDLSEPTNASISGSFATVTINDNDDPPTLSALDHTVSEGAGSATLTVRLSEASAKTVTVNYQTSDGTATDGDPSTEAKDYTATSGTLTITAGQTSGTVTVRINSDSVDESNETFRFTISSPSNATISSSEATVTITDNPVLSVGDMSVDEDDGSVTLTVTLDAEGAADVKVSYETSRGSSELGATTGLDYTFTSGTLTIAAGERSATVTVPIIEDAIHEWDETFTVYLLYPHNASLGDAEATVTINDNDDPPSLSVANVTVNEGDANHRISVEVSLSAASGRTVTVSYATSDDAGEQGADSGSDYSFTSGTLTILPGRTTGTVRVVIGGDTTDEWDETFTFTLSNPQNATGTPTATVTITDNDPEPTFSVVDVAVAENVSSRRASVVVRLSAASGKTITVDYATSNGSDERDATAGSDYTATTGSLSFAPGQAAVMVHVPIIDDTTDEWTETFTFSLSNSVNAGFSDSSATVTINDDDPEPSVSLTGGVVGEAIGNASVVVRLSAASGKTITVDYATSDGSAEAPGDYTATSGTLTFTPGQTTKTVSVPIISDTADEADETFTVALSNPVNVTGTPSATITIGDNPTLSITDVEVQEGAGAAVFTVTLDLAGAFELTVDYATSDRSAEAPGDYTATSGTLTIPAGTSSGSVSVPIIDDSAHELHETFTIGLSNPSNASLAVSSAQALIFDNDPPSDEPREVFAAFLVRLSAVSARHVSVDYTTVDGTATAGVDYTETTGTLTIPPGNRHGTIRVPIIGEVTEGLNRMFTVRLSNPRNALLRDDQADAAATILDDDQVPRLTIGDATAPEGGVVTFPVTLSSASDDVVVLDWVTVDVTAEGDTDYVARQGRLTIPRGRTEGTIRIRVRDDRSDEPDETFALRVVAATNARRPAEPATGTIVDDDDPPILTVTGETVPEDAGFVEFTVWLSTPSGRFVTADFRTVGGTATAGVDYSATTGTLIIPPGRSSVVVRVPVSDDRHDEGDETFMLRLTNARHATLGAAGTATIADDDGLPSLAVADAGATEGAGAVTFTVTLSEASATDVSVGYFTVGGTARSSLDFQRTSGTLTIPAGETTATIRVPIIADQRDEPAETFTLTLSRPVGAMAPGGPATGTIADRPTLRVAPAAALEGAGAVTFTVTLDAVSHEDTSVDYATAGGTATSGVDFRRTSGTLTIPAGETAATIQVPVIIDRRVEPAETFTLTLRAPRNAALGDGAASATGTIVDDDGLPRLSVADVTAAEGDGAVTFTVTLDGPAGRDVSVTYATVAGTASRRLDFSPVQGRLTIPAGSGAATIRVPIVDDSLDEPAETFTLRLRAPRNAALGDGAASATGTIIDDDGPPHLAAADVTATEGDAAVMFTVTLDAPSSNDVSVNYATVDGTATAGEDYTAVSGTLTIPAGESVAKISVSILDDSLDEPAETFTLTLSGAQNAVAPAGPITATILDDEPGPSLTVDDVVVPASSESVTFTVSLSAPSGQVVRVDYRAVEAAAGAATSAAGTLTIPAGETTAQIEVPVGDGGRGATGTRQITLTLRNARNATLDDATATATITRLPILAVADATAEEGAGYVTVTVSLSAASDVDVRVRYATVEGTASRRDYRTRSGTLTIPAGRLSADIVVPITDDSLDETDETFTLVLTDARNAAAPAGPATITIVDDDGLPTLEIADVTVQEGRHTP